MQLTRTLPLAALLALFCSSVAAQFSVSKNHRYLNKDGEPFLWIGDTAWELFHRLDRGEADRYLKRRSEQGFTVIQAVVLAEMDGLHTPNAYDQTPLINDDPRKPNEKYFEHVDYIIDKAAEYKLSIALLPTWGDKIDKSRWGMGPEIFTKENAQEYASWLAGRYKNRKNVIWILGGDRTPRNDADLAIWRAMGTAIKKITEGRAVISFHPQPNKFGSAEYFHDDAWLDFNMFQTGHCRDTEVYDFISSVYSKKPTKPVLDGEPIYEDHPVCFNVKDLGLSNAFDIRRAAYLNLFAGAFGHTYGCHDVWQMYSPKYEPVNGAHIYWYDALELPGANQLIHLNRLLRDYPPEERQPAQDLLMPEFRNKAPHQRIQAAGGRGCFLVYSASGLPFELALGKLPGDSLQTYWFNPRDGKKQFYGAIKNSGRHRFQPPTQGYGQDWVLIADSRIK